MFENTVFRFVLQHTVNFQVAKKQPVLESLIVT